MYIATLNELKVVLKVNAQAGQSGIANNTSFESTAQDDEFRELKRRKRCHSDDTSQTAKKSIIPIPNPPPSSCLQKQSQLATSLHLSELRTWARRLLEQRTHHRSRRLQEKSDSPTPIIMTSTTNLIRFQSDLKEHVKREYEFRYTRYGTRIITKGMADYSAMKSYLEKYNLHYFTFSSNSERPL
jgi:hypothetical protein